MKRSFGTDSAAFEAALHVGTRCALAPLGLLEHHSFGVATMLLTSSSSAAVPSSSGGSALPVTDRARLSLERLLDLGVQVVDGNVPALLEIPAALADALDGLNDVHGALEALPVNDARACVPLLVLHVARRKQQDLEQLRGLVNVVAATNQPEAVGRKVVIAALVLLSNLESDERWYVTLNARRRAA